MEYTYNGKTISPNLDNIHSDVNMSGNMNDQSIEWCRWDEALEELKIVFSNTLSDEDKSKLDTIVSNNS